MQPKKKSLATLQKEVDAFNAKYKVGDTVKLQTDGNGPVMVVKVKHEATILGNHTSVGWFEGISGCYALHRVVN